MESSCCKHMNDNENDSYDDDDVDTVLEEISIDCDDLENHDSTDTSHSSGIVVDPNDTSVHGAVPCCAICLDKFDMGDDISYSMDTTKCHHEYHTLCITEWLMKHPNCPYCRRNYIPLPPPSPSPPADAIDPLPSIESSETLAAVSTNSTLPDQSTPPSIPVSTLPQSNPRVRTFGYPILWTSFWRRSQQPQQELFPPDSEEDIESGRISTAITTTASVP
jgi:Ring finger domain